MYKYLLLIAIAAGFGCQSTTKTTAKKLHLDTRTEILTVKVTEANRGYDVEAMLYEPALTNLADAVHADVEASFNMPPGKAAIANVITAPRMYVKPNQWGTMKVAQEIKGYSANASYLVGGEMVDVPAEAGINLTAKVVPLDDGVVWLSGVMALSKFDDAGRHGIRVFPVDVECKLGQAAIIYKTQTVFDREALRR